MKDIVIFSTAEWTNPFWTNKQHVAAELAQRGFRVLYIDSVGLRRPSVSGQDIKRILKRLKSAAFGAKPTRENLWVWSPLVLPLQSYTLVRKLNRCVLTISLWFLLRRLKFTNPILWTYNPLTTHLLDVSAFSKIVYHCVDNIAAQPGMPAQILNEAENSLLLQASVVFATAPSLAARCLALNANTHYFPNVADYEHFSAALRNTSPLPADLAAISPPRLGFIGAISGYKIDFDLLCHLARERPAYSIVLVGKVAEGDPWTSIEALSNYPNIHLLGPREYKELPQYLKGFDIALLPNTLNEYTRGMFPMKFFEYLAAGRPVVSVALEALAEFKGHVSMAHSPTEFVEAVDHVLAGGAPDLEARLQAARQHTYASRMDKMLPLVKL